MKFSILFAAARSRNLVCTHQIPNILLQELAAVVQLFTRCLDGLDAAKNKV